MSKCPFISRAKAMQCANWAENIQAALLIQDIPDPDPDELIAAAIRQMDSEQLQKMYLKMSECLFRSITNRPEWDDTVHLGLARPGTVVHVDITVEDGIIEEESDTK